MLNKYLLQSGKVYRWLAIASLIVAMLLVPAVASAAPPDGKGGNKDTGSAPTANDDTASTPVDMSVEIDLLANDTDPDDSSPIKPQSLNVVIDPRNGSLRIEKRTGIVTYTPESGFVGSDVFVYTVSDTRRNESNQATVTIEVVGTTSPDPVNQPPTAQDDTAVTDENASVEVAVLNNDSDPDGELNPASVMVEAAPANGVAEVDPVFGSITYKPKDQFAGSDSLQYSVADDAGATDQAQVDILVEAVNERPVVAADLAETDEDVPVTVYVLANDSDPDSTLDVASVTIVSSPLNGVASVDPASGAVTYTPAAGFYGEDSLTYTVADSEGAVSGLAQVTITVHAVNAAPLAEADLAETDTDTPVSVDVLANDSDSDGMLDPASVAVIAQPASGTVSVDASTGAITYTPVAGFSGEDSFEYTVLDNEGAVSDPARVTITVVPAPASEEAPVAALRVDADGIYRVTYEALLAAGLDFQGVPSADLALTSQGISVPLRVIGPESFGPGSALEFVGQALDTLYTDTNVYLLSVDAAQARRIGLDAAIPVGTPASSYQAAGLYDENIGYAAGSPLTDPWYAQYMQVSSTAKTWTYTLDVDHLGAGPASLTIAMYGITSTPPGPDHHVMAALNGTPVMDKWFTSNVEATTTVTIPAGILQEGSNNLTLTLPADTGTPLEIVGFEGAELAYSRAFVASDGALTFSASNDSYQVRGLDAASAVAYRVDGGTVSYLSGSVPAGDALSIPGTSSQAAYFIADSSGLRIPAIAAARPDTDITSGSVDYLIIAHPDFVTGIQPLAEARAAQGYTVRVVDVRDVYAQFSGEVFDPQAIKRYIGYAVNNMGTDYVLLVGGDTSDYRHYVYADAVSYIPSLYAPTPFSSVRWAPAESLYADIDNDLAPEVALGRFPVRTPAELDTLVQKTLAYPSTPARTAMFAADEVDVANSTYFNSGSNLFASRLGTSWAIQKAYLDDLALEDARAALIGAINSGVALTSYYGHASYSLWNYDRLFTSADARALTNADHPTIVTSFGCWTTAYAEPDVSNALYQAMLFNVNGGAAAYMGSSALSNANYERDMGLRVYTELAKPGMTIGQAVMTAKASLAASRPWETDMLFHWTILGDPTLVVTPAS